MHGTVISHFVKRNALSRLSPPAWALAPIWYGNTFFHNISSVLCSVNSKPTRCCSVKAVMLCSGSVTELFGSLDAAQTSHTLAGVFHDSLYKSRQDFRHPSASQLRLFHVYCRSHKLTQIIRCSHFPKSRKRHGCHYWKNDFRQKIIKTK